MCVPPHRTQPRVKVWRKNVLEGGQQMPILSLGAVRTEPRSQHQHHREKDQGPEPRRPRGEVSCCPPEGSQEVGFKLQSCHVGHHVGPGRREVNLRRVCYEASAVGAEAGVGSRWMVQLQLEETRG